jgi:hypothetical protein
MRQGFAGGEQCVRHGRDRRHRQGHVGQCLAVSSRRQSRRWHWRQRRVAPTLLYESEHRPRPRVRHRPQYQKFYIFLCGSTRREPISEPIRWQIVMCRVLVFHSRSCGRCFSSHQRVLLLGVTVFSRAVSRAITNQFSAILSHRDLS